MTQLRGGTLFSGGGGFCLGMVAAGVDHAWGVEYDDKIAQVARDNGLATITADILQCDPADFEPVDFLHASPPCPNFSNAKANAEETDNDRALAAKVCQFITELLPRVFTLENVYQYRNSQSWETIARTLLTHGYQINYWHVNMADYGVPQTRQRMIVIARRDGITPMLPPATHSETPVNGFFERRERWVSWHEAIEDLIPTLPDSEFAKWQLERLPKEFRDSFSIGADDGTTKNQRSTTEPANTVTLQTGAKARAFIAPGGNATSFSIRNEDEPARVVGDVDRVGNSPRAFIEIQHTARDATVRDGDQPVPSISASGASRPSHQRAIANGRVVKMTPRALARFQAFPDGYELPDNNALACRIIGNAVPPLFAQRLVEWLI
jgi:DNA (cytosine-5)-methyltransferase 1